MKEFLYYFFEVVYPNAKKLLQLFVCIRDFVLYAIPIIRKFLIFLIKKLQEPQFQKKLASTIAILAVIFVVVIPDVIPKLVSL